eukprot:TRINITY_DN11079_c0_g1_i2.p1 TRINITY_DN11079_c0_g1~~TRINITY_DN11079_c0_g1_i2.p1  ORF type:complete len:262 (-),score=35.08 TRINITY_DN11079_c0_g1_i2:97-882(-)
MEDGELHEEEMHEEEGEAPHDDIWDDGALISAYNQAIQQYQAFHGSQSGARKSGGRNRKESTASKKRKLDATAGDKSEDAERAAASTAASTPSVGSDALSRAPAQVAEPTSDRTVADAPLSNAAAPTGEQEQQQQQQQPQYDYSNYYNFSYGNGYSSHAAAHAVDPAWVHHMQHHRPPAAAVSAIPVVPPAPPPVPPGLADDETFAQLLRSWYYSGYYAGLYQGRQGGVAKPGTGPATPEGLERAESLGREGTNAKAELPS